MSKLSGSEPIELFNRNKLANIVIMFVFVGPPLGGLTLLWFESIWSGFSGNGFSFAQTVKLTIAFVLGGLMLSYLFGVVPAAIVGVLVGLVEVRYGRTPWYVALALGLAVGLGYAVYRYLVQNPAAGAAPKIYDAFVSILICVVPTMICWALVRKWYSR